MKRAAVRFVAGVLAASGALAALLAWRLARGPIDMPLLTSYLARALSSEGGPTVRVRATELIWDRHEDELRLRARDVEVSSPTGAPVGLVPSLTLGLSLRALLRGVIAPAEVVAKVVTWLLKDPGAAQLNGGTIEAQHFCHERGLLPGWPGPRSNDNPIKYDLSGALLAQLEEACTARSAR